MIGIRNGDFERGLRGDIPPKLLKLKKWDQAADYPEDAGYAIKDYGHYNWLPENSWDMPYYGAIQIDTDRDQPVEVSRPWERPAEHFLDMGGTGHNSSLYQKVKHLEDEQPLTLSFDYFDLAKYHGYEEGNDSFYGASTLKVYWNNKQVAEISGDNSEGWAHIEINVMAGPNGEGELKIYEKGTEHDMAGIAIDNVSIDPVYNYPIWNDDESSEYGSLADGEAEALGYGGSEMHMGDNLVRNGSFEKFDGMVAEGGYGSFDKIAGWRPAERGAEDQFEIHHEAIDASAPNSETTEGDYYLDTGLTPGNMAIKQSIKGVASGDQIEISIDYFDHAMKEGKDVESSRLEVWWDDIYLGRIDGGNPDNWSTWTYRMTVPEGRDRETEGVAADHEGGYRVMNQLILKEVGVDDNVGLGIDNIQVHVLYSEYAVTDVISEPVEVVEQEAAAIEIADNTAEDELIVDSQIETDLAAA